jgi:hypothetical protein
LGLGGIHALPQEVAHGTGVGWFASGCASAMCVLAGEYVHRKIAPLDAKSFFWLGYICLLIFYLAFALGYLQDN